MSAVAEPIAYGTIDDGLARRNAMVLAVAQALAGGNNTVIVSTASIVGAVLAPDKGLATLPITAMVIGMWFGTLPVGALARRFGRRFALQTGSVFGILSGLISYSAVMNGQFWLLLIGTFCGGLYAAAHNSYRFAAADTASEAFRPKVVSWVLAGGVFAAVIGPQLVIFTKDLLSPHMFAASYLGQSACALIAALVLMFVKIPPLPATRVENPRPLAAIVRTPRFIVAVACGMASYAMMNMVMTSAPLAMIGCGHSVTDATLGIQWHVLAMYAPSFVTGGLIVALRGRAHHRHRPGADRAHRGGRHRRHHGGAFLERAGAARGRLEFGLHRRHHHGDPVPPAAGAQQGAGVQRLPDLRQHGGRLVLLRPTAGISRLAGDQRGDLPDHFRGRRDAGVACAAQAGGGGGLRPLSVMPGQKARSAVFAPEDPGIHDEPPRKNPYVNLFLRHRLMDCRVKPGNDKRGKTAPAMAAGVTGKLWEISNVVATLEKWEAAN